MNKRKTKLFKLMRVNRKLRNENQRLRAEIPVPVEKPDTKVEPKFKVLMEIGKFKLIKGK